MLQNANFVGIEEEKIEPHRSLVDIDLQVGTTQLC